MITILNRNSIHSSRATVCLSTRSQASPPIREIRTECVKHTSYSKFNLHFTLDKAIGTYMFIITWGNIKWAFTILFKWTCKSHIPSLYYQLRPVSCAPEPYLPKLLTVLTGTQMSQHTITAVSTDSEVIISLCLLYPLSPRMNGSNAPKQPEAWAHLELSPHLLLPLLLSHKSCRSLTQCDCYSKNEYLDFLILF